MSLISLTPHLPRTLPIAHPGSSQEEMMQLISSFRSIDVEERGSVAKQDMIKTLQDQGESYDAVRETLKEVDLDSSGRVELEDYVDVSQTDS